MPALPSLLLAAGAAIVLCLGTAHLWLTFRGTALHPRDESLTARMREVTPRLTRQTTMWRAWVGFNASHSVGAMLFGLTWGYLALVQPAVLFASVVPAGAGAGHCWRAMRCWAGATGSAYRFAALRLAAALYVAALIAAAA
jgi:hypothetical protein